VAPLGQVGAWLNPGAQMTVVFADSAMETAREVRRYVHKVISSVT
jgi:hypothetical protein